MKNDTVVSKLINKNDFQGKAIPVLTTMVLVVAVISLVSNQKAYAGTLGDVEEYSAPSGSRPYGIIETPDGNLWFTDELGKRVITSTKAGSMTPYSTGSTGNPGDITLGPDSLPWFTYSGAIKVSKVSSGGTVTDYALPTSGSIIPDGLTTGPDGNMWIIASDQINTTKIYRMNSEGDIIQTITPSASYGVSIIADYERQLMWFAARVQSGPNSGRQTIGKVDMSGNVTEYLLPSGISSIYTITKGPDGNIWYAAGGSKTGYITDTGTPTGYTIPGGYTGIWTIRAGLDGNLWATLFADSKLIRITPAGTILPYDPDTGGAKPLGLTAGSDGNMWFTEYNASNIAKIGTGISGSSTDVDDDGLDAGQELRQGTKDTIADTDGDGLNDYTESQWNTSLDDTFCDGVTCAYPRPLQKDIYVEIDWMLDYQPTATHLNPVKDAFMSKGIRVIFDTGQYGGGNQVPDNSPIYFDPTEGEVDFFDYKRGNDDIDAQFDSNDRYRIWHYMLMGYNYTENSTSSGRAYPGDDDAFISYGLIEDGNPWWYPFSDFDTALSGTIIHELGHDLCLAGFSAYTGHDSSCVYDGIDNDSYKPDDYVSSMNYKYQFDMVNYSSGANGAPDDHDDWNAVMLGIDDFADTTRNTGDILPHLRSTGNIQNGTSPAAGVGAPVPQINILRQ